MNRRARAVALILLAPWALALAGCGGDGEIIGPIESALPSVEAPTPTTDPGSRSDEPTAPPTASESAAPQPTPEPEPTEAETPQESTPADASTQEGSGLPLWAWILIIVAVVGGVAGLIAASRKRGGDSDHELAARADGQLSWVRSHMDEPTIRWRAQQLGMPAEQRDTDSEQARTWASLDQRMMSAGNDLLTLQSGAQDEAVRQAAGMMQQSADGYRKSAEALAASIATGDASRISEATQAFQADAALFDRARQRLREAAKL